MSLPAQQNPVGQIRSSALGLSPNLVSTFARAGFMDGWQHASPLTILPSEVRGVRPPSFSSARVRKAHFPSWPQKSADSKSPGFMTDYAPVPEPNRSSGALLAKENKIDAEECDATTVCFGYPLSLRHCAGCLCSICC